MRLARLTVVFGGILLLAGCSSALTSSPIASGAATSSASGASGSPAASAGTSQLGPWLARVVVDELRIREDPSTDSTVNAILQAGMDVRITGDPEEAGDMTWYPVVRERVSGWVAAGSDGEPWLLRLANGLVAYADADDGISGIDPVTLEIEKLASGGGAAGPAVNPAWAPDGTALLFQRDNQVWRRDEEGNENSIAEGEGASWSPDGTKVLHQRRFGVDGLDLEIFVARSDGSEAQNLTNRPLPDYAALWSPDGRSILFGGGRELWVMNRDGSQLRQVTASGTDGLSTNPVWEPDSTHLAFATRRPTDWEVRRTNIDTLEETPLSSDMYTNWTWSPDGTLYALFGGSAVEIYAPGGELQASFSLPEGHFPISTGVWSPDGRLIAVSTVVDSNVSSVVMVPLDGSQAVVIEGQPNEVISWQPLLEPL